MKRYLILTTFAAAVSLLVVNGAWASPVVTERDLLEPFRVNATARDVVVEYFTASKNANAARASSLIDYDEWAKAMGLEGEDAKERAKRHREELVTEYRAEKTLGSTKAFKIVKENVEGQRATFEVTQDRIAGVYTWEVQLLYKNGRWVIVSFVLKSIARQPG
jgi:hypothetical protein